MKLRLTLRIKAIVTIIAVAICIISILSFFFIRFEKEIILKSLQERGLTLAKNLSYNAEYGVLTANNRDLMLLADGVMKQSDVAYCLIKDATGKTLTARGVVPPFGGDAAFIRAGEAALAQDGPLVQRVRVAGESFYDIAVPVISEVQNDEISDEMQLFSGEGQSGSGAAREERMQKIGIARVGMSLVGAERLVAHATRTVVILTIIIICMVALLTVLLISRALEPIRRLVVATNRIAKGDLNFHVDVKTDDELGELSRAFNTMTQDLKHSTVSIERLKDEQQRFQDIVETTGDWIWEMTLEGQFTYSNSLVSTVIGYSVEEVLHKYLYDFFPSERREELMEKMESLISRHENIVGFVRPGRNKNGEEIYLETNGVPIQGEGGVVSGYRGVTHNITRRKRYEEELRRSQEKLERANRDLLANEQILKNMITNLERTHKELKAAQGQLLQSEKLASIGQLAAGVAHEINNPVGFITSNLSTLEDYVKNMLRTFELRMQIRTCVHQHDWEGTVKKMEELEALEKEVNFEYIISDIQSLVKESQEGLERIGKIVMDLKTFARRDDTRMTAEVNAILEGVLNIVWNELKYKVELKKEYGELPKIECNPQQLGQVFINMLINAGQAIKEKGLISVRTYLAAEYICVEISDTGAGMPPEIIKNIFDPFFTTKDVGQGTGLGLSISYEIVRKHGGTIEVDSTVGKGSTFTVKLPAYEPGTTSSVG